MKMFVRVIAVSVVAVIVPGVTQSAAEESPAVKDALARAGANRAELVKALQNTPAEQAGGMAFLIANMPERDLKSLKADFLLENVRLAYEARRQLPWGAKIPEEIFLNDVLPYANVDESRHPWRKELYDLCLPLVKDCKTPAEAAQQLNETIYKKLKVRYSTQRLKAHQSPKESIAGGTASCTGLSILLSDACRSVAVPARLVGTPLWMNNRGNHTWVEIWDGRWHFTGACEPDARGLDHAWFEGDAAKAEKDSLVHAIYAASFRKTEVRFPLVWAPNRKDVSAENVTDHYARKETKKGDLARVMIRVWDAGRTRRLAVPVTVLDRQDASKVWHGESRGETADANNFLTLELPAGRSYLVRVEKPGRMEKQFTAKTGKEELIEVVVPASAKTGKSTLSETQRQQIARAAHAFFTAGPEARAKWRFDAELDALLSTDEQAVRQAVWKAYREAPIHEAEKDQFDNHQVRYQKYLSPYTIKKVGNRPEHGWPLFIALHGGGGAPKAVNDSQWKHMQIYYRDQKDVPGYQYVALRAPNDTWNGFYDDYVPPLITNLIGQFLHFGDVDPNKVYVMGYSHGGYGAFWIGPKIPDRFAAVHCSASAPTDGSISPRALRNTRFTFMIGEKDDAYGRRKRCLAFDEAVKALKKQDPDGYPVEMEFKPGYGHGGLPDRDKIKDLYPFTRNPVPTRLYWDLTDSVVKDFYWLSVPQPAKGESIEATIQDNTVRVSTQKVKHFDVYVDARLVDLDKPVRVEVNGQAKTVRERPRFLTLCQSLLERGDPELAFTVRLGFSETYKN
jgi:predicted peptidase/transglutaminase-like putative cysteine protease